MKRLAPAHLTAFGIRLWKAGRLLRSLHWRRAYFDGAAGVRAGLYAVTAAGAVVPVLAIKAEMRDETPPWVPFVIDRWRMHVWMFGILLAVWDRPTRKARRRCGPQYRGAIA